MSNANPRAAMAQISHCRGVRLRAEGVMRPRVVYETFEAASYLDVIRAISPQLSNPPACRSFGKLALVIIRSVTLAGIL
jgi:hypothetical protein